MSALTKVFVVLLVICSMLLTAAVVVFVNKQESFQTTLKATQSQRDQKEADRAAAVRDLETAQTNLQALQARKDAQADVLRADLSSARQQLAAQDVRLAKNESDLQSLKIQGDNLTAGMKASEESRRQLMDQLADSRKSMDDLTKKYADLNAGYSDLQNRYDQTTRELRNTMEELQLAKQQVSKLTALAQKVGVKSLDEEVAKTPGISPSIVGVIRDVQNINGVPYATISVGAAADVTKNMTFNVVDTKQGVWMGTLTVDSVGDRDATGRLQLKDPKLLNQIKANETEVRTQLQ